MQPLFYTFVFALYKVLKYLKLFGTKFGLMSDIMQIKTNITKNTNVNNLTVSATENGFSGYTIYELFKNGILKMNFIYSQTKQF